MPGDADIPTIAVPYCRQPGFLRQAVDSVFAQSDPRWRLIVIDDAAAEPAAVVLADHVDGRLKVLRNDHRVGIGGNWNRALDAADSDVVTLLHADDRLRPDYLRVITAALQRWPRAAMVATGVNVIGANDRPRHTIADVVKRCARRPAGDYLLRGDDGLAALLANNTIYSPTLTYRRSLLPDVPGVARPFDPRWSMVVDLDLIARTLLCGGEIGVVRQELYDYRRHGSSASATSTRGTRRFEEELALYHQLADAAAIAAWPRSARVARRHRMVSAHIGVQLVGALGSAQLGRSRRLWRLATSPAASPHESAGATTGDQHLPGEGANR